MLTYNQYIQHRAKNNTSEFHLNFGGQYNSQICNSDIIIMIGNRGSSKSTSLLLKGLRNIFTAGYNAVVMRREIKDSAGTGGIVDASKKIYSQFGKLRESLQLLDWRFTVGSKISFINYSAPLPEFREKVQGKEMSNILIDEICQMEYGHFNILMANLRNTIGIKPQLVATANPDANSWVKDFISPYIDYNSKYHTHNPELNGKEMYFFQVGGTVKDIIYGRTREEVYENAKEFIDEVIANSGIKDVNPLDAILSISVFYMPKSENKYLLDNAGGGIGYDARLSTLSLQEKVSALWGGWKKVADSELALIKQPMLDKMYENSEIRTGTRYASMDLSGKGKDKTYLLIWDGNHLENIYTTKENNAKQLFEWTVRILNQERIPLTKNNFIYDAGGLGYAFSGYFTDEEAFQFQSSASPSISSMVKTVDGKMTKKYANLRSEACGRMLNALTNYNDTGECGISIDEDLLNKDFYGMALRQRIESESKGLRWRDTSSDGVFRLVSKDEMDAIVGHHPDFIYAFMYRFVLDIQDTPKGIVSEEATEEDMLCLGTMFFNF